MNEQINENLQQLLDDGNEIRAVAGAFPFLILSFCPSLPNVTSALVMTQNGKRY